jgi:hypothetical protein
MFIGGAKPIYTARNEFQKQGGVRDDYLSTNVGEWVEEERLTIK